ncbi:MAG: HepT-like ribonuclease domain-containing protein [Chloroflexota bacterium]
MPRSDDVVILDMLIAAQKIQRFSKGLTRETIADNEMAISAIVREFQVIGEAARMVSDEFKAKNDDIPWRAIRASYSC